jgi:Thioesterase-like superfamily
MTQHIFDAALKLQPLGARRYTAHTSDAYWNMVGPFGGVTAAIVLHAVLQHQDVLGAPLSLTVNYAAALRKGPFEIQLQPVRTNRSTQHWTIGILQKDEQGELVVTTTATVVTAVRRETWSMSDTPMPAVAAPQEVPAVHLDPIVAWLKCYEMRPISGTIPKQWDGRGDSSLSQLWMRDALLRPLDFCSLAALSDVFFPRVWLRRATYVPAGTVSITTYFHAGEKELLATGSGFVLGQARAQEFRNGFFDQSALLWNEAGALLCTSHQIVYFKE